MLVNLFPIFVSHTWGAVQGIFRHRNRENPPLKQEISYDDVKKL
jgi:hypothetical protein